MNSSLKRLASQPLPAAESILLDHKSSDVVWIFKPTNVLEESRPPAIRWDFQLPSGCKFTHAKFASLRKTCQAFIALIRVRSVSTGLSLRATTVVGYFQLLRALICFMESKGFTRFASLDAQALREFQHCVCSRRTQARHPVAPTTVQKYLYLLIYLYRYRGELDDGLQVDPCPGETPGGLAHVRESAIPRLPYTPEAIAVPLIQRAIGFLSSCAVDLLRAREIYMSVRRQVRALGYGDEPCRKRGGRALRGIVLDTHRGPVAIHTPAELGRLLNALYIACFVILSYVVGARASEILQLKIGCLAPLGVEGEPDTGLTVIRGAIFKHEAEFHGRPHEWVAPPEAVHAITVLEALSAPHRARTGRDELWLRAVSLYRGASEWHEDLDHRIIVMSTHQMRVALRYWSAFFDLPRHAGKRWRLSTHQGRKTFVRFAALRDRSALFAIAEHLGHRERGITDYHYAGSDHILNREIDHAILEQSVGSWEEMLSCDRLSGRAGQEILAKRPRFKGERMKGELKRYARMLVEAGLTLGVCDWGFCVYRQESSACLGSINAPNPIRREPSTCANCRNFAVGPKHLGYWREQVTRHRALLNEPALPRQSLQIVRERLTQALAVVRSVERSGDSHEHTRAHRPGSR